MGRSTLGGPGVIEGDSGKGSVLAEPRGKESVLADSGWAGEMAGGGYATSHKSGLGERMDHFRSEHWTRRSCRPRPGIARPIRQAKAGPGIGRLLPLAF